MKQQKSIWSWLRRRKTIISRIANRESTISQNKDKKETNSPAPKENNVPDKKVGINSRIIASGKKEKLPKKDNIIKEEQKKENEKENIISKPRPKAQYPHAQRAHERDTIVKPNNPRIEEVVLPIKKTTPILTKPKTKEEQKANDFIEEKTILNEIMIKTNTLEEIEKMLKENFYEIQKIQFELDILEEKEEDEVIAEEVERLLEELNKLIKKFEEIKKDFFKENYEEIYKSPNNDGYINQLIKEYQVAFTESQTNEASLLQIKQIEEYIILINEIIDIENRKDELNQTLENKKEELEIRDKEFEKLKDETVNVEKMNNYIESFASDQELIIKQIEEKVRNAETITKKSEYKTQLAINYTRLLVSTLALATTKSFPPTGFGNALKMGLMIASIGGMASSIRMRQKETKVITNVTFTDYANEIISGINNVDNMSLMLDKAMMDIKFLKDDFAKEFSEYINDIPEYYEIITKLDTIEKDLLVKQELAKKFNKKLEKVLDKNNVKVKRLEEEYPTN